MIRKILKFFGKPVVSDYFFYDFRTTDRQLFSLKLELEGVIWIKINNVKVPKKNFYIIAPISGSDEVKLELKSLFFKNTFFLKVKPRYSVNFNSPEIHSSKDYNLFRLKNIFYKRKLMSFLSSKKAFDIGKVNLSINKLEHTKKLELKAVFESGYELKKRILIKNKEFNLNEIVEKYG